MAGYNMYMTDPCSYRSTITGFNYILVNNWIFGSNRSHALLQYSVTTNYASTFSLAMTSQELIRCKARNWIFPNVKRMGTTNWLIIGNKYSRHWICVSVCVCVIARNSAAWNTEDTLNFPCTAHNRWYIQTTLRSNESLISRKLQIECGANNREIFE